MKKRLLFLVLLMVASFHVASAQNAIAIYQKGGEVVKFAFSEKPVVSYMGNDLILTTTKTSVRYPVYLLQKIAIDLSDEFVDDVQEVKRDAQFRFEGGNIIISGGDPGSSVYLYDISGVKVGQYRLDSKGSATVPIQSLGNKLYIVKTSRFTFKFRKS